eukprot:3266977-Pyramimonas_sp.AAC.1
MLNAYTRASSGWAGVDARSVKNWTHVASIELLRRQKTAPVRPQEFPYDWPQESHQPSGRRWFNKCCPLSSTTPPSPAWGRGPGRGAPRSVRAPKMAQDSPKRASNAPRWFPRWTYIPEHGAI